jgi:hypothetical protein
VISALSLFRLKPVGLQDRLVIDQFGRQDASAAHGLAAVSEAFVHQRKAVALAQVAMEIKLAAKNLDHLHGDGVGNVGIVGGGEQGVANFARLDDRAALQLQRLLTSDEAVAAAFDDQHCVLAG